MLTGPQFPPSIPEGAAEAQAAVTAATLAAGREPGAVTLVAVSKLQPATAGENYVKEGVAKVQALAHLPLVWHFIGALQANKTRAVAEHFDWVHTVDRFRLAERLSAQRPPDRPPLQVCLQVMLETEPGKAGLAPTEVPELAIAIAALPGLQLRGLMCIPPPETDPVRQRRHFRALAALLRELQSCGLPLDTLSMGMSGDFAAAILEGATHVRLGTAIFGSRPSPVPRNSA